MGKAAKRGASTTSKRFFETNSFRELSSIHRTHLRNPSHVLKKRLERTPGIWGHLCQVLFQVTPLEGQDAQKVFEDTYDIRDGHPGERLRAIQSGCEYGLCEAVELQVNAWVENKEYRDAIGYLEQNASTLRSLGYLLMAKVYFTAQDFPNAIYALKLCGFLKPSSRALLSNTRREEKDLEVEIKGISAQIAKLAQGQYIFSDPVKQAINEKFQARCQELKDLPSQALFTVSFS